MKVLFAVNNESISEAIIKKYQKDYREILSYKNVYYFNAIQKEIQKDKSYDRIIISEDLEPFSNNNYESIDRFIFEKLDGISDEAHDVQGNEISIIIICSDRHTKGSSFLVKLFGIGIYNALLGTDRSMEEVCRLINKPRTKKEAKMYYKIDTDDVNYRAESENEVSELEIQNIIAHFKKLGKNTEKYSQSFENIASQYTDEQLKIIINCLPMSVKAVLEETSSKYQEIMSVSGAIVKGIKSTNISSKEDQKRTGLKIDIIENKLNQTKITKPIVIPNSIKTASTVPDKKVSPIQHKNVNKEPIVRKPAVVQKSKPEIDDDQIIKRTPVEPKKRVVVNRENSVISKRKILEDDDILTRKNINNVESKTVKKVPTIQELSEEDIIQEELENIELPDLDIGNEIINNETKDIQKRRGRPRKVVDETAVTEVKPKGKRGRPRKVSLEDTLDLDNVGIEEIPQVISEPNEEMVSIEDEWTNTDFDNLLDENDEKIEDEVEEIEEVDIPELDELEESDDLLDLTEESFDEFDDYDEYGEYETKSRVSSKKENIEELYEEDILADDENENSEEEEILDLDDIDEDIDSIIEFDDEDDLLIDSEDNNEDTVDIDYDDFEIEDDDSDEELTLDFDDNDLSTNIEDDLSLDYEDDNDLTMDFEEDEDNSMFFENQDNDIEEINDEEDFSDVLTFEKEDNEPEYPNTSLESIGSSINYSMSNLNSLMTKDKKIVTFLGSQKNGVSFLVNNLAEIFASVGINTAILDMTKNKNSYYIYTQNEESLRQIAYTSIEKLKNGVAQGLRIKENLTVYTALPNDGKDYNNAESILSTLVQNHSLVLIDCDFETNPSYFSSCQEIYLVQSMDILTIQPLTAFLRDLKTQGVLEPEKVRVVINKELKVRGLTEKAIIGGMSFYNDPAMSFMTELFNKDIVKYCSIPFEEMAYSKYLEAILNCKVSIKGYSKNFMNKLRVLGDMVYPLTSKQAYIPNSSQNYVQSGFSNSMNDTLSKMKKKF